MREEACSHICLYHLLSGVLCLKLACVVFKQTLLRARSTEFRFFNWYDQRKHPSSFNSKHMGVQIVFKKVFDAFKHKKQVRRELFFMFEGLKNIFGNQLDPHMFRVKRRGVLPLIVAIEKSKFRPTSAEQRPFEYDALRFKKSPVSQMPSRRCCQGN